MPRLVWLSLTARLSYRTSGRGVALAEVLRTVVHDRVTRMLPGERSGHPLLDVACRTLFVWERGVLILDDTLIPKPLATALEGLAWGVSSQARRPVSGCSLVLLVWTEGRLRISLGVRLWHNGGPQSLHWPWSGSATPAIARVVARPLGSLMPGIVRKLCSSACVTMAGLLAVVSRRIVGSTGTRSVLIGGTPPGRLWAGYAGASKCGWSDTAPTTTSRIA
jgi:hypothetical protein